MGQIHDDPEYRRRRKILMASKTAKSVCWRCGEPERPNDRFQAGHLIDGNRFSRLDFEHASCNQSAGGKLPHMRRTESTSRDWTKP